MSWKDPEKAETLSRLWAEGHSCTVIARMMGAVSRNAIIGAVRRQGLPFRGYRPGGTVAKRGLGNPRKSRPQAMGGKIARTKSAFGSKKAPPTPSRPVSPFRELVTDGLPLPTPPEELFIPVKERKSVATLEPDDCRWPHGDPQHPAFHFCGKEKYKGLPYCKYHALRAYVLPKVRQRQDLPAETNVVQMPKREPVAA